MFSKSNLFFHDDNISSMFLTTALAMIIAESTGVVAVLIDGIITSQFLGGRIFTRACRCCAPSPACSWLWLDSSPPDVPLSASD